MSRRRYLSTNISTDPRVNRLVQEGGYFAALLYTWMIPHADDEGRLTADREELMYLVIPGQRAIAVEEIDTALAMMESLGLIELTDAYVQFPSAAFYRYQTYIKEDRRVSAQNTADQRGYAQNTASVKPSSSSSFSHSLPVMPLARRDGASAPRARRYLPITEKFTDALVVEFGPKLGGEHRARDAIEAALNHTALDKAKDKRLYLRRWLQQDAEHYQEPRNGATAHDPTWGWDDPADAERFNGYTAEAAAAERARRASPGAVLDAGRAGGSG